MYIACPRCSTNFVVTPEQLGPIGRRVKCSKCANIWYQEGKNKVVTPSVLTPDEELTSVRSSYVPYGNGVNLPALLPIKIPSYLYLLPIAMIMLIVLLVSVLFYDMGGLNAVNQNKLLSIKDVHMVNDSKFNKIIVSYSVMNSAGTSLSMPLVRIRMFDISEDEIVSHIDSHSGITLSSGQYVRVKTEFPSLLGKPHKMDIMLGNKLDFMLH